MQRLVCALVCALSLATAAPALAHDGSDSWRDYKAEELAQFDLKSTPECVLHEDVGSRASLSWLLRRQRVIERAHERWSQLRDALEAELAARDVADETSIDTSAPTTSGDLLDALARCESGMQNLQCAPYCGYFQFVPRTYASITGRWCVTCDDYATQKAAAAIAWSWGPCSQFPTCAAKLGAC